MDTKQIAKLQIPGVLFCNVTVFSLAHWSGICKLGQKSPLFSPLPCSVKCSHFPYWKYCRGPGASGGTSLMISEILSDADILGTSPTGTAHTSGILKLGSKEIAWLRICPCSSSSHWALPGPCAHIPDPSCSIWLYPFRFLPAALALSHP